MKDLDVRQESAWPFYARRNFRSTHRYALKKETAMPAKARHQFKVRYYECDPLGHVNHAVYVSYFETGRLEAMAACGLPFSDLIKQGYALVASKICVQYKMAAVLGDQLEVQTWITGFRGARSIWQQELYRCRDNALLAQAVVHGAFTTANGRPIRIPARFRQALEAYYVPDDT
jgi:acyl-CoA thioester hydrolase